jgi:hypothetical protein
MKGLRGTVRGLILSIWLAVTALSGSVAGAQELEPGAYAVAPVGVNVVVVANILSKGDLAFDPSGPISDSSATINVTSLGYVRTLNLAGRSTQVAVGVPIVAGHVEGLYLGEQAAVTRVGMGDPRVRFGINLYGAPAMGLKTFAAFRPKRLFGASVTVLVPLGRYSTDRLINVGGGRWAFKPELGLVQYFGRWTVETFGGVWLFTRNDPFYKGSVRTQDPIASFQFHASFRATPRVTLSGNTNFYKGGQTTVNGTDNLDLQRNSRVGLTLIRALSGGRTLRVALSQGAVTTIGADFTSISVSFQRVWGGRAE